MAPFSDSLSYITGLLLLLPGVVVLTARSALERREEHNRSVTKAATMEKEEKDFNVLLIPLCLACWIATFLTFWLVSWWTGSSSLPIFDRDLTFRPFVPLFGLIGSMVFVIDLFRGKKAAGFGTEFALRLVLGPYVVIVMVVLFQDNFKFVDVTGPKAQAALAFFSGFLVVFFLQGITERGNELLGRWREGFRYEPSEIAAKFKQLRMQDDLRLRQNANLKYLAELRTLPDDMLKDKSKEAGLGEGMLLELKRKLELEHLQATLGEQAWKKLGEVGIETVNDVAALAQQRLVEISEQQGVSQEALDALRKDYQALVKSWKKVART